MNNIQELIERPLRNAIDHIQHECYNDALSSIHETIAALESMLAPPPEDVADAVSVLRAEYDPHWIADMLERLWRENAALMDENVWLQKAQARIEELDKQASFWSTKESEARERANQLETDLKEISLKARAGE